MYKGLWLQKQDLVPLMASVMENCTASSNWLEPVLQLSFQYIAWSKLSKMGDIINIFWEPPLVQCGEQSMWCLPIYRHFSTSPTSSAPKKQNESSAASWRPHILISSFWACWRVSAMVPAWQTTWLSEYINHFSFSREPTTILRIFMLTITGMPCIITAYLHLCSEFPWLDLTTVSSI